ncbi:dimeric dUTPase (all-alpha-NTP-PPase superfamily) [Metamycoplasma subdolum]|uniref:Dimeric dUTPase (All-alpha-NTP-PPase superfamily) n=1 Tax=Metamycoplasma subdolum TaxID=92407 RepID=A0A3M0AJ52_9BACT|nr:dUTP diphosphatase [Metamycoplasma subdolum]RMA79132.1 dimeric dUTPase (all-alpha-NTP-PPase superfamily) [Metamycoplasma subdolum]WPB50654.1 dUTP diphosphatase [Metamycoplasma subdolum]
MKIKLEKIFELQRELDESLNDKVKSIGDENIDVKRIIALLVELGEFANEVKLFKYWKKQKALSYDKVYEECADVLHFISSIATKNNVKNEIEILIFNNDFSLQLAEVYKLFVQLLDNKNEDSILKAFGAFLGLTKIVNLDLKKIEDAYIRKNKINHDRIKNNY